MRGTLNDAMIGALEDAANVDLGEFNDRARHHMGGAGPHMTPGGGFSGYEDWDGYSTLVLGYEGLGGAHEGFGRSYRQRRKARWRRIRKRMRDRNKRVWRRHVARRRAWCKKHKKFCNFWQKNWDKIVKAALAIVGAVVSVFTFGAGAAVAAVLIGVTEAAVSAGRKAQDCMKAKKKSCWKAGLKEFGVGAANTAMENAGRMADKFGVDIKLSPEMTKKFKGLMNKPAFKKMKDLYKKIEKGVDDKTRDKIMDEINALDEQIHEEFADFEEELDDLYWAKAGWKREWREDEVLVREDKKGDKWAKWDSDTDPPEGIEDDVWYRLSGETATTMLNKSTSGDVNLIEDSAAAEVASRATTLEKTSGIPASKTVAKAVANKKLPTRRIPTAIKVPRDQLAKINAQLSAAQRAQLGSRDLYRVGGAVVAAKSPLEARANVVQAAAEGRMSEETAEKMGFASKVPVKALAIGGGLLAVGVVAALALRKKR